MLVASKNVQHIPAIWSVIQATKEKSFDTYPTNIAKSINLWCRSHHIDCDKSIFLKAKFFEDLVALRFNPGGPVAQCPFCGTRDVNVGVLLADGSGSRIVSGV
jgi:hypothetical protein